jgi:hypothetical protein
MKHVVLAVGIIVGAYLVSNAVNNHTYYGRSIDVKGLSERDVIADSGSWTLTISLAGDDVKQLNKQVIDQKTSVREALIKAGFKAEEINTDLPANVEDKMLDRYNDRFDPTKQARYILETSIQITTEDVEKLFQATHMINDFIADGIVFKGSTTPQFFYEKLNEIKPEMLKEASENAHTAAIELAHNTKSKIGKIKRASQGIFSIRLRTDAAEGDNNYGKSSPYLRARVVTNVTYFIAD